MNHFADDPLRDRITTKRRAYELYHSGAFGNALWSWDWFRIEELADLWEKGWRRTLAIRYKEPGSDFFQFDIPGFGAMCVAVARLAQRGARPSLMVVSEQADDSTITIQGEVMRSTDYLTLKYSTIKRPMRLAFREEQLHARGAEAVRLLRAHMEPTAWDNLWELFDRWPDAVVEFSCYERGVGKLNWNTIFWEVRHY